MTLGGIRRQSDGPLPDAITSLRASPAIAVVAVAAMLGCGRYSGYARTVHRDVDIPTRQIALTVMRLQRTVVHGSVPADSVAVWARTLHATASLAARGSADFAATQPPDPTMAGDHYRLAETIAQQSAAVATAAAIIETCVTAHGDGCDAIESTRYYTILSPLLEQQDMVRWSRARLSRDLESHGILLSVVVPQ